MTLVKICGITSIDDALMAASLGADAVGFIFCPSPRRLAPESAARITASLPKGILKVGVFANQDRLYVAQTARACGLDAVQLHGEETPEYARSLPVAFIKAFRARDETVLAEIAGFAARTFLLDAYDPQRGGGTGSPVDLALAARASKLGKMILAGGLRPENVAQAVRTCRPYAVDVSSGVESAPGVKDRDKVKRFIEEAKKA